MTEFLLPELGDDITGGDVASVLVSVGDSIDVDTPVLEIETDKAVIEVPSSVSGVVQEIFVQAGDNVESGQKILTVGGDDTGNGDAAAEPEPAEAETADAEPESTPTEAEAEPETASEPEGAPAAEASGGTVDFVVPELGDDISGGDIVSVMVEVGATIAVDDPVLEIETDKAVIEVPSTVSGVIEEIFVKAGEEAKPGQKVMTVSSDAPASSKVPASEPVAEAETKTEEAPAESKQASAPSAPATSSTPTAPPSPAQPWSNGANASGVLPSPAREILYELAPAAPSVRRFAREVGVDIRQVPGSGPGGRITQDDVKAFAKSLLQDVAEGKVETPAAQRTGAAVPTARSLPDFSKFGPIERERMSNVRRATANHMAQTWPSVPHVTHFDKADITNLEKLRKQFGPVVQEAGAKLTPTAIILKVMGAALKKFPKFAASIDMENEEIVYKQYIHIGVAVDTPRGLLVPVIRDVDQKNLVQLSIELGELADKARRGKTQLQEMQGGVMSLTNLGGIGGTNFTPIVNWPEVAILGVARGSREPVFIDGKFEPRMMLPLSLSYDHRLIDGADGARFLRWVAAALEEPFSLLVDG